jgi:hypothetical protein
MHIDGRGSTAERASKGKWVERWNTPLVQVGSVQTLEVTQPPRSCSRGVNVQQVRDDCLPLQQSTCFGECIFVPPRE